MNGLYKIQNKKRGISRFSIVILLILINVILFFATFILMAIFGDSFIFDLFALKPSYFIVGKNLWSLLTSMFMHLNFAHLFFNMISLFFVGTLLERIVGKKRFLLFYIISGLFAGLFFATLSGLFGTGIGMRIFGDPNIPGIGASGAVFGLVGVLAVLIPKKKIYLIGGPLIAIILQSIVNYMFPANPFSDVLNVLVSIYIFFSIFTIFSFNSRLRKFAIPIELSFWLVPIIAIVPLLIIGLFVSLPIGNMAHLGGLIAGLAYGFYLRKKYQNKTRYLSQIFH